MDLWSTLIIDRADGGKYRAKFTRTVFLAQRKHERQQARVLQQKPVHQQKRAHQQVQAPRPALRQVRPVQRYHLSLRSLQMRFICGSLTEMLSTRARLAADLERALQVAHIQQIDRTTPTMLFTLTTDMFSCLRELTFRVAISQ